MLTFFVGLWHTGNVPTATGVRERNRAETMARLKEVARRHLAEYGAAALSLRAVTRELGMVSSAVYRYVAGRDELLTLLIIDAYDAVGAAAEQAAATSARRSPAARWLAVGSAVRDWALANPHEYALVYGSPVPGYAAPEDTIVPATRVTRALVGVVADAHQSGRIADITAPVPAALRRDLTAIAADLGVELPPAVLARAMVAWTQLFGLISFELFGQTRNAFNDDTAVFTMAMQSMATYIGLE